MSQIKHLIKDISSSNKALSRKDIPLPPEPVKKPGQHHYDSVEVDLQNEDHYEKLVDPEDSSSIKSRLQAIEDTQRQMLQEFRTNHDLLLAEIRKLQDSIEYVKTINYTLQKSLVESSTIVQESIESLNKQFLETSDHLGQHVLQVRKDIMAISKKDPLSPLPLSGYEPSNQHSDARAKHIFEWDIQSVDNLVKTQGQVSSHSYHIGDLNYKVLGGAEFNKDGIMMIRMYGESTHPSGTDHLTKSGRFDCKVTVTDRTGNMVDWVVGKVVGNFFKEKMWMVGSVGVNELKKKGYLLQGKSFKLKFAIDVFK